MKKQIRTSIVINKEIQKMLEAIKEQGINISYEFRNLVKKIHNSIAESPMNSAQLYLDLFIAKIRVNTYEVTEGVSNNMLVQYLLLLRNDLIPIDKDIWQTIFPDDILPVGIINNDINYVNTLTR